MRVLLLFSLLLYALPAGAQEVRTPSPAHQPGEKTFVHFGWSSPSARFVRENPDVMATLPFDGVAFHLGTGRWHEAISYPGIYDQTLLAFADRPWTAGEVGLDELGDIAWPGMADSYIVQMGQSFEVLDWFDDALWDVIAANAALVSQAVAESGARGILFDPEYYDFADYSPWRYFPWAFPDHSFEEVEAQARLRGAEYVQALQSARPEMEVLALWWMSVVHAQVEANGGIEGSGYELMRGFLNGMLDAAQPGLTLIDGNEGTYYIDESWLVSNNYDYVRYTATGLLDAVHRPTWQERHQTAYAVYADYPLGLDPAYDWGHPADFQLDWFEHNLYHALLTTDAVVWMYDEEINWYDEPERGWAEYVPPGTRERIQSARAKLAAGEGLGFDLAKPGEFWFDPSVAADRVTSPAALLTVPGDLVAGQPFTLAVDVDGDASFVSFIVNGAYVGDDFSAPFEMEVAGLPEGPITAWARAETGAYEHVTTPPVTAEVARNTVAEPSGENAEVALRLSGPNPARAAVRLTATLPSAAPARADVFDVLGRRVAVLHDGRLAAGTHLLALDAAGLPPGLYVARLTAGDVATSIRFTVVR